MANIFNDLIGGFLQNYTNPPPQDPAQTNDYSHENVVNDYKNVMSNTDPNQLQQAHESYYQQIPENQRESLFNNMVDALKQHGIDPSQAGVNGSQPTPQNLANLNQYVSQKPDLFNSLFGQGGKLSSPLAKMALIGAMSVLANKFMNKG